MRQWTHVETLWTRAPSRLPDCVTGGIVDFLPTPLQVWITSSAQSSTGGTSRGNKQASWVFRHLLHVQLFLPSHSQVDGDRNPSDIGGRAVDQAGQRVVSQIHWPKDTAI